MSEPQRPTWDDPVLARASEVVGGPAGERATGHPWWTPMRVIVAIAAVTFLLGMIQKTPCVLDEWRGSDEARFGAMCYSDVPYLYASRGFAERVVPFTSDRYELEYPVLTGYFMYGAALVTHVVHGWPDIGPRQLLFPEFVGGADGVWAEAATFFMVNAVLLALLALLTAGLLVLANKRRPWDVAFYAASPCLLLTGLINWDYLALVAVAGFLLAWSRGRSVWAGVALGLGVAAKLYPAFLLGALFAICLRRRELARFWPVAVASFAIWLAVNLPAMVGNFGAWRHFWGFNSDRGADLGSLWLAWQQLSRRTIDLGVINTVSELAFGVACVAILVLVWKAPRPARLAQVAFLVVLAFVVVNKVYSPQYVLWLLPLAALARPRMRDQVIWQAAEVFYFAAVWWYLGGFTAPAKGSLDVVYVVAILTRVAAQVWLAGVVVRDIWRPEYDEVEGDPLWPEPADFPASTPSR